MSFSSRTLSVFLSGLLCLSGCGGDRVISTLEGELLSEASLEFPATYVEDSTAEVDMNVVVLGQPGEEPRFVEVQGTAEGQAFSRSELDALLGLATGGLGRIIDLQSQLVATPPASKVLGR